jgi:DNA invertase Pin-like site-specific DNA recombinase
MTKRALILVRVSSDGQSDNYSPESQEEGCRVYAGSLGMDVAQVLTEVISGAYEFAERPVLTSVLDAIAKRQIDALILHRLNRATRAGGIHALILAQECERSGVQLHFVDGSVKGQVDVSNIAGQVRLLIAGDQASEERKSLIEAMARGRRTRAANYGRPLAGRRVKYGYTWVDEVSPTGKVIPKARTEICDPEAAVIRRIYVERRQGVPTRQIASRLMADGIPNSEGGPNWSHGVVRKILTNPRYMGVAYAYTHQKKRIPGEGRKYKETERPESERVLLPEGTFPAIVSAELWHAVQARLGESKAKATRHNPHPERTLLRGGYVVCAECGNNMNAKNLPDGGAKYWCAPDPWNKEKCGHPAISARTLDGAVWRLLQHILRTPELVASDLAKQQYEDDSTLVSAVDAAKRVLDPLLLREKRLIAMASSAVDEVQAGEMEAQLAQITNLRQSAQQAVNQAQRRLENRQQVEAEIQATAGLLLEWSRRIEETTWEERRVIVRALVEFVRVWPSDRAKRWEIGLRFPKLLPIGLELDEEDLRHIVDPSAQTLSAHRAAFLAP